MCTTLLQTAENIVYRVILRAPSYVAAETLRGEIGASSMESRLAKGRLLLAKSFRESDNGLVREIMGKVKRDDKNFCDIGLRMCMEKMGMDDNSLSDMSKEQVKERVIEIDTGEWRRSMETKSTLHVYRRYKVGVKEEDIYRNNGPSVYLYRAMANALGVE